jgi:hypothetical protein
MKLSPQFLVFVPMVSVDFQLGGGISEGIHVGGSS